MRRAIRYLFFFAVCSVLLQSRGAPASNVVAPAMEALMEAAPRAQLDPARPVFHVTAPAQWINDPNGPIFHKGVYHLFYQLHPFSEENGPKYWGHVQSTNLVNWEHLPIAIAPSSEVNEEGVWSGCCVTNGNGEPMIFYTSVERGKSALDHSSQWVVTGDDELIQWEKSPDNPVLSQDVHGGLKVYDWRDPFIFHDDGRTFMAIGGSLSQSGPGDAIVNVYEAKDRGLCDWRYCGVLFHHPDDDVRTVECPNFFDLQDEWVLFVSPYGKVQYFIGSFDAITCRFQARARGILDYSSSYYAPNTMLLPDGRRLVWGWIRDFPAGRGWNGCLSLPRLLSLSPDGQLLQTPAPELAALRGDSAIWRDVTLTDRPKVLPLPNTNTLEIEMEFDLQSAAQLQIEIKSAGGTSPVTLSYDGLNWSVLGSKAPLYLPKGKQDLHLRLFLDRSVLEVFANQSVCLTKVIPPLKSNPLIELRVEQGRATANRIEAWPIRSIW